MYCECASDAPERGDPALARCLPQSLAVLHMAEISVATTPHGRVVIVEGDLAAADLQGLEHACGPALEQARAHLEIVMRDGSIADASARAYLARLRVRGVVVRE